MQVGGRDKDVVDIEKKATACPIRNGPQELGLAHRALGEGKIGGGVFQKHPPPEHLLDLVDVVADAGLRGLGIGERQEIVEIGAAVARPG